MSRQLVVMIFCMMVFPATAFGQTQLSGYAVGGVGFNTGFFSAGQFFTTSGGGELVVHGVGVGAEAGLLGNASSALSILSINGVFQLALGSEGRFSPFLTGGYTRMGSGEGDFDAWNIGAGATVWSGRHAGVRIEVRDHVRPDRRGTVQYFAFRVGVALR